MSRISMAGGIGCFVVILCSIETSRVQADAPQIETGVPAPVVSADTEKQFQKLVDALKDEITKRAESKMQGELDSMASLVKLTKDQSDKLATASKPVIAGFVDDWLKETSAELREETRNNPDKINVFIGEAAGIAESAFNTTDPSDRPDWEKAVSEILTPEQKKIWDKNRATDQDKAVTMMLESGGQQERDREINKALVYCHKMEKAFSFDDDRKEKIEELAGKAIAQYLGRWREKAKQAMKGNLGIRFMIFQGLFGVNEATGFEHQSVWTKGLNDILSSDELVKVNSLSDQQIARRVQVMGLIFIAVMDKKAGLTSAERERLKPLAERLVKDDPVLCPQLDSSNKESLSGNYIRKLALKASDAELEPILSAKQMVLWKSSEMPTDPSEDSDQEEVVTPQGPPAPDFDQEPEHLEHAISSSLYEWEQQERKKLLIKAAGRAEQIIQIISATPDLSEKLRSTIVGLVERRMLMWNSVAEQQMRSQLGEVTPNNVDDKIPAISNYVDQIVDQVGSETGETSFRAAIKSMFSEDQLKAIQAETDSQQEFSTHAISELVANDFSRRFSLDETQSKKMEDLIGQVVKDYIQDIPATFGFGDTRWYFSQNLEYLPLMGLKPDELKTVLNPDQISIWEQSQEHQTASAYWPQFEQVHQNRLKGGQQQRNSQPNAIIDL